MKATYIEIDIGEDVHVNVMGDGLFDNTLVIVAEYPFDKLDAAYDLARRLADAFDLPLFKRDAADKLTSVSLTA